MIICYCKTHKTVVIVKKNKQNFVPHYNKRKQWEVKKLKKKYEPMTNLKIMRIKKGLTQIELSKKVGISDPLVFMYEGGYSFPRRDVLYKLAEALECEVSDII